jgi:hypothetical protein
MLALATAGIGSLDDAANAVADAASMKERDYDAAAKVFATRRMRSRK